MNRAIIILVFFAAFLGITGASASTVKYNMTFHEDDGTQVAMGSFLIDHDEKVDIYLETEYYPGSRCYVPSNTCQYAATWTPIDMTVSFLGQSWDTDTELFAEGTYFFHNRYASGRLDFGEWIFGDIYFGTFGLITSPPDFADLNAVRSFNFPYHDLAGYIRFSGPFPVPLPPALPVFVIGLAALAAARRQRGSLAARPG